VCTTLYHRARLLLRDVNLDGAACRVIQEGRPRHIGILALEAVIGARSLREGYYKGSLSISLSLSLSLSRSLSLSYVGNSGHRVQRLNTRRKINAIII